MTAPGPATSIIDRARGWTLGGATYRTKKAVIEKCRDMLYARTALDEGFLLDLLKLHDEAELKIGCGVLGFSVRPNPEYGNMGFWLKRVDGTETDWSFTHCLTARTPKSNALTAMRFAVSDQVRRFKTAAVGDHRRCAVTGAALTLDTSHADHHPVSFHALALAWMETEKLVWSDIKVNESADGSVVTDMADQAQRDSWAAYHAEHARLRLVTQAVNQGRR